MYPCVGMQTHEEEVLAQAAESCPSESSRESVTGPKCQATMQQAESKLSQVLANFGDAPFKADVDNMRVEAARRLKSQIRQTELPGRGKVWDPGAFSAPCHRIASADIRAWVQEVTRWHLQMWTLLP